LKHMPLPINDIATAIKGPDSAYPKHFNDVIVKLQRSVLKNQNPGAKYGSDQIDLSRGGNTSSFGFLSSGQREEMQQVLHKIKGTGKKVPEDRKVVVEEAEMQDQTMTALFNLKDEVVAQMELDLKSEIVKFTKTLSPVFGQLKAQLIAKLMEAVKLRYHSLPADTIRRLETNLAVGGRDVQEEDLEKVLVEMAFGDISSKASQALHSTATIASDYMYEKLQDQLQDIFFEFSSEAKPSEEPTGKTPVTTGKSAVKEAPKDKTPAPPPKKAPPKPPPKTPTKKPSTAKESTVPEVKVEELPKVESNLSHTTKDRVVASGKRPPTRKPRVVQSSAPTGM